ARFQRAKAQRHVENVPPRTGVAPMICHYCNREALGKCISCGLAICPDHGNRYCKVCSNAVFSHETATGQREGKAYLQCPAKEPMPTVYIDDDGPPECYECQRLARRVCQTCHNLFCPLHGHGDQCQTCHKASAVATWVTIAAITIICVLSLVFFLVNHV